MLFPHYNSAYEHTKVGRTSIQGARQCTIGVAGGGLDLSLTLTVLIHSFIVAGSVWAVPFDNSEPASWKSRGFITNRTFDRLTADSVNTGH